VKWDFREEVGACVARCSMYSMYAISGADQENQPPRCSRSMRIVLNLSFSWASGTSIMLSGLMSG